MKSESNMPHPATSPTQKQNDHTKLVSLLALATGAVAMPQTGNADIIYTDLSSSPGHVGFSGGYSIQYLFGNLPGTAQFGFKRHSGTVYTSIGSLSYSFRSVFAGKLGGAAAAGVQGQPGGFANPLPFGAYWDQGLGVFYQVQLGSALSFQHSPADGYEHKYLAWLFHDTTQPLVPFLYGWAEVSLSIGNIGPTTGPNVTIWGYAYDNTGVQIKMGEGSIVPEPAPVALLALGAMTLGAKGVRCWRRNRPAASKA